MPDYKDLDRKAIKLSQQICRMCTAAGSGHPSSALSLVHITIALMYRVMRYDPKDPWNTGADRLVLSEGHAVPAIYAAYCDLGGVAGTREKPKELTFDDALTLREGSSTLDGHPNPARGFPFFDAATGSLGQGLSVAAGLAAAARLDESDKRIFTIMGDGESREGQIWEGVDFIVDHGLRAVRMIFNCNGQAQSDYVSAQQSADCLAEKLKAFGCEVLAINGHDWGEVLAALRTEPTEKPVAIVAKTIKGWGVTELQKHTYHGKPLNTNQLDQAMVDLNSAAVKMGVAEDADDPVAQIEMPKAVRPLVGKAVTAGSFSEAMRATGLTKQLEAGKLATRRAYGVALAALGSDERIVAIDGDVRGSTFANIFAEKYPARFFDARIAEQNMISAAVGLAANGRIPFASSFAKFLVRGYDQLEMAAITNADIKLCGSHAGVSLAADGPSQMGLPDLAFMRSFAHSKLVNGAPAMRIFLPSDAISAFKLTELMANTRGLCYMRTHRPDVPFIYDEDESFTHGGFKQLTDGKDITIVASGYMVHVAREAIALLQDKGISAALIDAYSIPLDAEGIVNIAQKKGGRILVAEDNYIGGVIDEIALAASASGGQVTVAACFVKEVPKSAKTPSEILEMVNLTPRDLADAARKMLK